MTRIKRGTIANKKRKEVLKHTKGFRWGRKSKERAAKEALLHAWTHMWQGRKQKKRDYRALWNVQINAAARQNSTTYRTLIHNLKKAGVGLDRKVLAEIAEHDPKVFSEIVNSAS
jgi:large subunit ribosomal protein L20